MENDVTGIDVIDEVVGPVGSSILSTLRTLEVGPDVLAVRNLTPESLAR